MTDTTPRWQYRFDNYHRAFSLLREAMEQETPLTQLEKEGVILEQITPRTVIRKGFEAGIIQQGEVWQNALDARNKMSHTYNFESFERVIDDIRHHYLMAFDELHEFLLNQRMTYPALRQHIDTVASPLLIKQGQAFVFNNDNELRDHK